MPLENETINKFAYFFLFASYIAAVVLIGLQRENFDKSIKAVLEGLTAVTAFLTLLGVVLLFGRKNFKTNLLFLITNIIICGLSVGIIVIYARYEKNNTTDSKNIIFLTLIGLAVFLSGFILLNDILSSNLGPAPKKTEK